MLSALCSGVCICAGLQQLNLPTPTGFPYSVCQTAACVVREKEKKPSSPLRRVRNASTRRLSYLVDAVDGVSAGQCDKVTVRDRIIAARTADEQSFASYAVLQPYVPSLYLGCRNSELGTASRLSSHRSETSRNSRMDVFIVFVSTVSQYRLIAAQNVVVCT